MNRPNFRGFNVGEGSWTYYDSHRLVAYEKLSLPGDAENGTGIYSRMTSSGTESKKLDWNTIKVLEGITERTRIVIDLQEGFIKFWVRPLARQLLPDLVTGMQRRLTISMSFLVDGIFHSTSVRTNSPSKEDNVFSATDGDYPSVWSWKFQRLNSDMQRLCEVASCQRGGLMTLIAITGQVVDLKETPLTLGWPSISHADRILDSMAMLVTSSEAKFVNLAPTEPPGETRLVKAHRRILAQSCPYFHALFNSGFAESSHLRKDPLDAEAAQEAISSDAAFKGREADRSENDSNRPNKRARTTHSTINEELDSSGAIGTSNDGLEDNSEVARDMGAEAEAALDTLEGADQAAESADLVPVIELLDITYEQLQALVYFIYTGIAIFKDRDSDKPKPPDPTTRLKLRKSPWHVGTLQAIDAMELYRIADKYDLGALRSAALRHIASEISIETLAEDLGTRDALHIYPPVKRLYLEYVMRNQQQISKTEDYDDIMNYFVSGPRLR